MVPPELEQERFGDRGGISVFVSAGGSTRERFGDQRSRVPQSIGLGCAPVRGWLKLVGASDFVLSENWALDRPDLLKIVRFGEVHPPTPIFRRDRLVFHAVGHHRLVAVVEVLDDEATLDPAPKEWEKRWPLMLRIKPLVKVRKVSTGPLTSALGALPDLAHQSYLPLTSAQLKRATDLLEQAAAS